MSMHVLCEELAACLRDIQAVSDRMGEMNREAVVLQQKMHELQMVRQRIEVDLTKIQLEVL